MTTPASQKTPCTTCGKATGMFTCRGCQNDFCSRHVAEHRQELGKQIDELTLDHDRFRQLLTEQTKNPRIHPLMEQINEWEQQLIEKIRRSANEAREQLRTIIVQQSTELTQKLSKIADELRKARDDDDFFETDLKSWTKRLDELRKNLAEPLNIEIQRTDNTISATSKATKMVVTKQTFGKSLEGIEIVDNGQVIVKTKGDGHREARGSGEYSSDQHEFRFRIENYSPGKWILIGIVSKNTALRNDSYANSSSYGWAGGSQVYIGGTCHDGFGNFTSDIEQNDVVKLFIDCDKRLIRLTNERTKSMYELSIDTNKCPFPWQIHLNLYYQHDRVRLLPN